ncbi:unnamed protein product [Rhodiola kirilowii]
MGQIWRLPNLCHGSSHSESKSYTSSVTTTQIPTFVKTLMSKQPLSTCLCLTSCIPLT